MILKAEEIAKLLGSSSAQSDPLVITPEPNLEQLKNSGSASLDLRLGTWFLKLRESRSASLNLAEPVGTQEARLAERFYIPFGETYYLHPRTFVLGATLEWVRLPMNLAAYVTGRSSWGRRGLVIATATGVHPGFTGCLTLEITNVGEIPIQLSPGLSICQCFLHRVETSLKKRDVSSFVGLRRPVLGRIELDEVATKLAKARNR